MLLLLFNATDASFTQHLIILVNLPSMRTSLELVVIVLHNLKHFLYTENYEFVEAASNPLFDRFLVQESKYKRRH